MQKQLYTLLLAAVYVFVVCTHIFLLPKKGTQPALTHAQFNSMFKRKVESTAGRDATSAKRLDKSVVQKDDNYKVIACFTALAVFLLLLPRTSREAKVTQLCFFNWRIRPHLPSLLYLRL